MTEYHSGQTPQEETKKKDNPWSTIVYGIALIGLAIFLYYTFDNMEKEGGSVRLNWMLVLAYKIGGKWTVAVILALLGSFMTYSGISSLITKNQQ